MMAKGVWRGLVRVVPMAGVMALAACAGPGTGERLAQRATTELVGMNKARLLACAGVPDRQTVVNGEEVYTYLRESPFASPGSGTAIGAQGGSASGVGVGVAFSFPLFAMSNPGGCRADVVLRDGAVVRLGYSQDSALVDCAGIVDNCLAPAQPAP